MQSTLKESVNRPLKTADWYALVFETADRLRQGLHMKEYEALHYADRWLRGDGAGNE